MKIGLIYLAAGLSRRFGPENKLLYPFKGKPLYLHGLQRLVQLQGAEADLVVVTNTPEIEAWCDGHGVLHVKSPGAAQGISYSIRAGLSALGEVEAAVFFVADQPKLRLETVQRFLSLCKRREAKLACLAHGSDWGNPGWFHRDYFSELISLQGDEGGKRVMKKYPKTVITVETSGEELEDIDMAAF